MLAIGGFACAVNGGPQTDPAPDEIDRAASPEFARCNIGSVCEAPATCLAQGGQVGPGCNTTSSEHCCNFPGGEPLEPEVITNTCEARGGTCFPSSQRGVCPSGFRLSPGACTGAAVCCTD
jgi:hypothetical protein